MIRLTIRVRPLRVMNLHGHIFRLRKAALLITVIATVAAAYYPSFVTLWKKWILWDQDLAHALPTIGVMLALLAKCQFETSTTRQQSLWYWLQVVALSACSITWFVFESLSISLPAYLLIIISLCLLISTSLSSAAIRATLPFIGLIIFTIPIWGELNEPLVNLSSKVVGFAVSASQLTALIDGNSIFLPAGTIFIADGCSGLRYFIISLLMGYIISLINVYSLRTAIVTLVIAATLGLLANWLRIYLLVLIGYHTNMQSSLMHDHETFGWIVFALISLPSIYFSPVSKHPPPAIQIPRHPSLPPFIALLIGPILLALTPPPQLQSSPLALDYLEQYQSPLTTQGIFATINPGIHRNKSLLIKINQQQLQIDLFTQEPKGAREEIVPYLDRLVNASAWKDLGQPTYNASTNFDVRIIRQIGGSSRILLARQYAVGNMRTASYLQAKLAQILAKINGENYFGLLVVQAQCENDCEQELLSLKELLATLSLPTQHQ